jgi:multiple sugar transport system substrate-binding protein
MSPTFQNADQTATPNGKGTQMTESSEQTEQASQLSRRNFLSVTALAGAGTVLAGCGGGSSGPAAPKTEKGAFGKGDEYTGPNVKLAYWNGFTGGDGPFMKQMVADFNAEHKNINVAMNTLQWGDFYSKVPNAVTSGSGPDVGVMHIDQVATSAARQVIIPLDEVAESLKLEEGDFNPVVWKAGVYKDARYGIPLDVHPLGFYYNKSLLEKGGVDGPPKDGESYDAAVKGMQEAGVKNPHWSTATWPGHLVFISLLNQLGGSLYDEEAAKATFASAEGVEALEWWVNWVTEGVSPKNVAGGADEQGFRQQRNALHWNGIWMMNEWAKVDGLQWAAAEVPKIFDQPAVWGSSHQFVVTSQAAKDKNKLQASSVFISWISEKSIEWAKSGQIPARNSARESAEFSALEVQSTLANQLDYVVFPPATPGIADVTAPTFEQAVNLSVLGKAKPKEALESAAKKADAILEQNRQKYGA